MLASKASRTGYIARLIIVITRRCQSEEKSLRPPPRSPPERGELAMHRRIRTAAILRPRLANDARRVLPLSLAMPGKSLRRGRSGLTDKIAVATPTRFETCSPNEGSYITMVIKYRGALAALGRPSLLQVMGHTSCFATPTSSFDEVCLPRRSDPMPRHRKNDPTQTNRTGGDAAWLRGCVAA